MPYENPKTMAEVLNKIPAHRYVLPAIQREFVWEPLQICRLFDSLMRGYPIGSFLFWKVEQERVDGYRYYGFVQDYHEKDNPHCPRIKNINPYRPVTAVLDGQQRLTALNIALREVTGKAPVQVARQPGRIPQEVSLSQATGLRNDIGSSLGDDIATNQQTTMALGTYLEASLLVQSGTDS